MKKVIMLLLVMILTLSAASAEVGLTSFKTYDISNPEDPRLVSQDIFKPYDLTMVKIWTTWCGYCRNEMPDLVKLKQMLPENVNLVTICVDAATETQLAVQILQMTGATTFPTLAAVSDMQGMLANAYSYPCTYFVDSEGNAVGEPIFGVPSLINTADVYLEIVNEVLSTMEA